MPDSPQFGLLGHPLGHSLSAPLHRRLFKLRGVAGGYRLLDTAPEDFEAALPALRALGGFNVTIPYKQRIIPCLDSLSEKARVYGAVNTVENRGGKWVGHNTDAEGFLRALGAADIPLSGRVLLCGAGGAASMMAFEAAAHGCRLIVAARDREKAAALCQRVAERFPAADTSPAALAQVQTLPGDFDLILNATPVGMFPRPEGCPVSAAVVRRAKAVFDAVYNPAETVLLREAAAAGAKTQGGLPMLVWQAAAAQEIWSGFAFDPGDIARLCEEADGLFAESETPTAIP